MDIIIGIIFVAILAIIIGLQIYFLLKEDTINVKISKNIAYSIKDKCEDNLDDLIEFSKSHKSKYKI